MNKTLKYILVLVVILGALFLIFLFSSGFFSSFNQKTQTKEPTLEKEAYPQQVRDNYMRSCTSTGGTEKICKCVLDYVEARMSFQEFSEMEKNMTAGNPPPSVLEEAIEYCKP